MSLIPYAGLRFVSALINAGIWFALGLGISFASSGQLEATGRFDSTAVARLAAGVIFLAALFGRAGAVTSFLDLAHSGKVALPDRARWGAPGPFDKLWPRGAAVAAMAAPLTGLLTYSIVTRIGASGRLHQCLLVGGLGAVFALGQSLALSGPGALGDLAPPARPAPASPAYLARRLAIPQAFGNSAITALLAAVTFSREGTTATALALDAAGTALVIGGFVLLGSSGIVATDRRLGRVEKLDASAPSKASRAAGLAAAVLLFAVLGAGLGALFGDSGAPVAVYVIFKGLVGATVAFSLAVPAGRAALVT
ncbi:MAG: hypothetical protein U0271_12530 [Polyangiaceae bacterium]